MLFSSCHIEELKFRVLASDYDIDIVAAAQAVISHRKKRVRVWWQVDADDIGFLVHDMIDESGVLVGEAVVVLSPDV